MAQYRKKDIAIAALISCPTLQEAARVANIGERTLHRWLRDESFQTQYRLARRALMDQAVTRIQGVISLAIQTLEGIMKDTDAPASAKVSAARAIIDTAIKAVEIQDLEDRIARLEKILTEKR